VRRSVSINGGTGVRCRGTRLRRSKISVRISGVWSSRNRVYKRVSFLLNQPPRAARRLAAQNLVPPAPPRVPVGIASESRRAPRYPRRGG